MANPIDLVVTNAGLDALVNAQNGNTEAVQVTQIGLTSQAFDPAPTLSAIPGEFKRIGSVAGQVVAADMIHMTAQDNSADTYDLRGIGLYLSDGTLFAAYGQADPIFTKVSIALFLLALNVRFSGNIAEAINFGDASFLNPPATEMVRGVAELATQAEVDAGEDDERIITPKKMAQRLVPVLLALTDEIQARIAGDGAEANARANADNALQALIDALIARTITGAGLVTGGGNLAASRVLQVASATAAQVRTGTNNASAITPAALGPIIKSLGLSGYASVPGADPANTLLLQWGRATAPANGTSSVTFPISFAEAFSVIVDGTSDTNNNAQDNYPAVRTNSIAPTGFQVFNANETTDAICYVALGRINLS